MTRRIVLAVVGVVLSLVAVGLAVGSGGEGFRFWGTREPIYIFGDRSFTTANGVIAGSGTAEDPYVIEGWQIAPANAGYGISIDHTTRHFVIRNCVIDQAGEAAIVLNSVVNGRVEACLLYRNEAGVALVNAHRNTVSGNLILENRYGVVAAVGSRDNVIAGNSFVYNGLGAIDPDGWNSWSLDGRGNFWSDYTGTDESKDGIGDQPYTLAGDRYPLVSPPVAAADFPPCIPCGQGPAQMVDGMLLVTSRTPIELAASDPGSGVRGIYFSIDGGEWRTYAGPFTLMGPDGVRRISYYAVDRLGNAEAVRTITVLLDNRPPETTIEVGAPSYKDAAGLWVTSRTPIGLVVKPGTEATGVVTYFQIDGGEWVPYVRPFTITQNDGPHALAFYSRDATGNAEPAKTVKLIKDDTPPTTSGASGGLPADASKTVVPTPPEQSPSVTPPPVQTPPQTGM